jgi:c-di-GMP-binding flagellar brake protein YcgR
MILYGILAEGADVRRFSKYGINALMDFPLDRSAVLNVARSTSALLLHELRRYVRIPLVIEVSIEGTNSKCSGSTREISGGGMSVQLAEAVSGDKLQLSFTLPDQPTTRIGATVCWATNNGLVGFQFLNSGAARQAVKDWISSFLGLD